MAGNLQDDQRALLQLLYERGQGYDDISGLLGVSVDEVRDRARRALQEIGGADPDAEAPLTDFLLGKADPIGRADAIRYLQSNPEALALSERIQAAITLLAPGAKPVKLPEPRGKVRKAALPIAATPKGEDAKTSPAASQPEISGLRPSSRSRLIAILTGVGVIAIVAILAIAGVFEGDQAAENAAVGAGQPVGQDTESGDGQQKITAVDLESVNGSGVGGTATFTLVNGQQLVVDVDVQGLDPSPPEGSTYLLWLLIGENAGYPISTPLRPNENGSLQSRIAVPTQIAVTFGSQASAVSISETKVSELRKEVKAAAEQQAPILPFVGTNLASGEIPLVQNGKRGGGNAARSKGDQQR